MAGSVNKVALLYRDGFSIPQIARIFDTSASCVRSQLERSGVALRSRAEGVRLAGQQGRLGSGGRGKTRVFTEQWKQNISKGRLKWSENNAIGVSHKTNGYVEHTKGKNKHRSVHVVKMERRLGRPLLPDECVHHIDGDKHNNNDNNLALVTRSGHSRLHRFEDKISNNTRQRKPNGRFS